MMNFREPEIMTFRPTMEEFTCFNKYVAYMEYKGAHHAGLAKVIPPPEWVPRKGKYTDADIMNLIIPAPISQSIKGNGGFYKQTCSERKKLTVAKFKIIAESSRYRTPGYTDYSDLQTKYWKRIQYHNPIYGADVAASVMDDCQEVWNIGKLGSILDHLDAEFEGVNTPYLYIGMWKTTFPWHTEDMDLYSINYVHFGSPKTWYAIPPKDGHKFESLMSTLYPEESNQCPAFLRHKSHVVSPDFLKSKSIQCNTITQESGEFMITFPFGYHAGFNHGFNIAEAINFASERWIPYGKQSNNCTCPYQSSSITFDMDKFIERLGKSEKKKARKRKYMETHENEIRKDDQIEDVRFTAAEMDMNIESSPVEVVLGNGDINIDDSPEEVCAPSTSRQDGTVIGIPYINIDNSPEEMCAPSNSRQDATLIGDNQNYDVDKTKAVREMAVTEITFLIGFTEIYKQLDAMGQNALDSKLRTLITVMKQLENCINNRSSQNMNIERSPVEMVLGNGGIIIDDYPKEVGASSTSVQAAGEMVVTETTSLIAFTEIYKQLDKMVQNTMDSELRTLITVMKQLENCINNRSSQMVQISDASEEKFKIPFLFGWVREVVNRSHPSRKKKDIYYWPPPPFRIKIRSLKQLENFRPDIPLESFCFDQKALGFDVGTKEIVRNARTKLAPSTKRA